MGHLSSWEMCSTNKGQEESCDFQHLVDVANSFSGYVKEKLNSKSLSMQNEERSVRTHFRSRTRDFYFLRRYTFLNRMSPARVCYFSHKYVENTMPAKLLNLRPNFDIEDDIVTRFHASFHMKVYNITFPPQLEYRMQLVRNSKCTPRTFGLPLLPVKYF